MDTEHFKLLSLIMRYWFTFLGAAVVAGAFIWLRREKRERQRLLRRLPDAGLVGELIVLSEHPELPCGTPVPVPWEGTLGSLRTCDITLPVSGVAAQHLHFSFLEGEGLTVAPLGDASCTAAGEKLSAAGKGKTILLCHGDTLTVGPVEMRLQLFAGVEATRYAVRSMPEQAAVQRQPMPQPAAQPVQLTTDASLAEILPQEASMAHANRSAAPVQQYHQTMPMPAPQPPAENDIRRGTWRPEPIFRDDWADDSQGLESAQSAAYTGENVPQQEPEAEQLSFFDGGETPLLQQEAAEQRQRRHRRSRHYDND